VNCDEEIDIKANETSQHPHETDCNGSICIMAVFADRSQPKTIR
jgi:hypothetical protein